MKKIIILLIGTLLLLNGVDIKNSDSNDSKKEWKYSYKISKKFSVKEGKEEEYLFTDYEVFNSKNQLIQEKRAGTDFTWITRYHYNDNGEKIKKVHENLFKPEYNSVELYSYDEKGVLVEVKTLHKNNEVENVRKIEKKREDNRTKFEYNSDGKPIKKVEETNGWSSQTKNSKPLQKIQYYGKEITTYDYNKFGNEIKKEFVDQYERIDKQVYSYNDKWEFLGENNTSDANKTIKEHYFVYKEYDEQNNLTKEYSKVLKGVSACRGGMSYNTPNYELTFAYDKKNRVIEINATTRSNTFRRRVLYGKYHTVISYEYADELLF